MAKVKTVIIDDEPDSVRLLQLQLEQHCSHVEVVGTFTNPAKALLMLEDLQPDLVNAVAKAEKQVKPTPQQLTQLQHQLRGEPVTKIAIPGHNGVSFIDLSEIVYAEASNNYSKIVLTGNRHFIISKTLKDVQEVLEEEHFLRVHRQYIVNLNQVKNLNRNEGILTMENGEHIPVARAQKERLMERYRWL